MKKEQIKKKISIAMAGVMMVSMLAGCSSTSGSKTAKAPSSSEKSMSSDIEKGEMATENATELITLNVSTVEGGHYYLPAWVAEKKGWFKDAGIEIVRSDFTNGPVQMEAIDSWDIGFTGIGGTLAGLISYDAILLGTTDTDSGMQSIFVRPDSAVQEAGQGHNMINDQIWGSAEAWKGMTVNCTFGNVLHYLLIKTLSGFGLTIEDINVNWMDQPTSNASFLAGEGDVACIGGTVSFSEDKKNYIRATTGTLSETGLQGNIIANPEAYENAEKREAMKRFLRVYFEAVAWVDANTDEAVDYMIEWAAYVGNTMTPEAAKNFILADSYYSVDMNYENLHTPASNGENYNRTQEQILNVLNFFIECEAYQQGDDERWLQSEHFDFTIIEELYTEQN